MNKQIPELDGLRGIAILMVLCYHYFPNSSLLNFGWSGVDLFFVLSGYLISSRFLPFLNQAGILRKFYWNRFLRIVPLYSTFLALFFAGWFILNSNETLSNNIFYSKYYWQFFIFIQNWGFIAHINDNKTHLQHLWSVAIEEQIYIVFPLILIFLKKTKWLLLYVFLFFLLIPVCRYFYCVHYINKEYVKVFWNTFFRADSFLAGAIIYIVSSEKIERKYIATIIYWLGVISGITIFTYILITKDTEKNNLFISSVGYTVISILYASALYAVLQNRNETANLVLRTNFIRYTGRISYGIYIFHWPLYILGFAIINKCCLRMNLNLSFELKHFINIICCIPSTYLISHLSFKYYEAYFLKWKIRYS